MLQKHSWREETGYQLPVKLEQKVLLFNLMLNTLNEREDNECSFEKSLIKLKL